MITMAAVRITISLPSSVVLFFCFIIKSLFLSGNSAWKTIHNLSSLIPASGLPSLHCSISGIRLLLYHICEHNADRFPCCQQNNFRYALHWSQQSEKLLQILLHWPSHLPGKIRIIFSVTESLCPLLERFLSASVCEHLPKFFSVHAAISIFMNNMLLVKA